MEAKANVGVISTLETEGGVDKEPQQQEKKGASPKSTLKENVNKSVHKRR